MKIALGQINTTPNDFDGNKEEIFKYISYAAQFDTDLIVFPELSIPGYLCKDLLYRKGFVEKNLTVLAEIAAFSREFPNITIIVGYIGKNLTPGKRFTNMAAIIRNGLTLHHYQKQLLPFYDVFDEGRYFEPGTQSCFFEVAGKKCALTICEDVWNDKGQDDYNYATNPVSQIKDIDLLVNISSSPYAFGKPAKRFKMLREISEKRNFDIVYVNQIGGQDELVFDGRSCILHKGLIAYETNSTKSSNSSCPIVDIAIDGPTFADLTIIHGTNSIEETEVGRKDPTVRVEDAISPIKEVYNSLVIGLRDYIRKTGFSQVVLGSSGGIDSAVVASLACDAIGPDNVHCIMMPSIFSSEGSLVHAKALHKKLGCHQYEVPIEHQHLVKSINSYFPKQKEGTYNKVADENIQARLRGLTVMHVSNAFGYLPLTTGNKTELALGYCTLYGDMNGGFNPIADLYKDQVYAIARHINTGEIILGSTISDIGGDVIPKDIIDKPPSAELSKDQTDEEGLGAHYGFLNAVVRSFVENHINDFDCFKRWVAEDIKKTNLGMGYPFVTEKDRNALLHHLKKESLARMDYYKLIRRIDYMEFKRRQAAPTIKASPIAFGTGRRLPIVQKVS